MNAHARSPSAAAAAAAAPGAPGAAASGLLPAELTRLCELEAAARVSPHVVELFAAAERDGAAARAHAQSALLHGAHLFTWMEVTARMQLSLVARVLAAKKLGAATDALDVPPALLAADVLAYAERARASTGHARPWLPANAHNAAMSDALTDLNAGVLCDATPPQMRALRALRTAAAHGLVPAHIQPQVRFNRCHRGPLRQGHAAPDAPLHRLLPPATPGGPPACAPCSLHELVTRGGAGGVPTLIIAGSYS